LFQEVAMPDVITEAPLLRIRVTGQPVGTVLHCEGEMDLSNVDCLRRALTAAIEQGHPEVEVDLRGVEFLDSSTIEALLTAHYELARQGRTLLIRARPWAAHVFRLVQLDRVLNLQTD
jgi:anti-anti-sigma factor